jgi:predicted metal-dependent enzyme (double-stranded beta helix superfamily)
MSITSFKEFCEKFRELAVANKDTEELVIEGKTLLSELISHPDFILENLAALINNRQDESYLPVDVNDINIYRDPNKLFQIRAFVWEPNYPYPIHDHGSWGAIGCLTNQVRETKYERIDDGTEPNHAELKVKSEAILQPGDTTFFLPLDQGIHRMQAFGGKTALTVHAYAKTVRAGIIKGFVLESNTCYDMFPVKLHRRILAIKALESINTSWAQEILKITARDDNELIGKFSRDALENIKNSK